MSHIFLIRHAQSANNALPEEERVSDPGLTPLGYRQAAVLSDFLSLYPVRRLFCSPFLRSLETTKILAERLGISAVIRSDLFEQGGCYSGYLPGQERGEPGMGRSELARRYPTWQIDDRISDSGWWGRPYETRSQACQRATRVRCWIEHQLAADGGLDAFIIHADFKRLLLLDLLGPAWTDALDNQLGLLANAGISHLEHREGTWILHSYNSVGHLRPEEQSH